MLTILFYIYDNLFGSLFESTRENGLRSRGRCGGRGRDSWMRPSYISRTCLRCRGTSNDGYIYSTKGADLSGACLAALGDEDEEEEEEEEEEDAVVKPELRPGPRQALRTR
ncbi:PREDICTED: uncharacterized protein LOC108766195 [Trachymyrmex cornetzi]|uniref:uncharacterized protein LOC108766195 n=1 Tax=Trachymyrmex cornetzi TaxID=471704 RepID=UPI00084F51F2|nr:PREDICTED: uncharacterized protein LOC108766195 [Trachymyrmex cornetzi]